MSNWFIQVQMFFILNEDVHSYKTRNIKKVHINKVRTTTRKLTLRPWTIKEWTGNGGKIANIADATSVMRPDTLYFGTLYLHFKYISRLFIYKF